MKRITLIVALLASVTLAGGDASNPYDLKTVAGRAAWTGYQNDLAAEQKRHDAAMKRIRNLAEIELRKARQLAARQGNADEIIRIDQAIEGVSQIKYTFVPCKVTWSEAKAICEALGGRLAVASTKSDVSEIKSVTDDRAAWLGARLFNGKWVWVNGQAVTFGDWRAGQPSGGEYLHIHGGDSNQWNATHNDNRYMEGFVFE